MKIIGDVITRMLLVDNKREILAPIIYFIDDKVLIVRRGDITDFASIPWFARWYVDNDTDNVVYASIIHDLIHVNEGWVDGHYFTLAQADRIFMDICIDQGMNRFVAFTLYLSLRAYWVSGIGYAVRYIEKKLK